MIDALEAVIRREMTAGHVPGLAIALVKGTRVVWSGGFGVASIESGTPVTVDTVFGAQSVTKPVTATALMQWHDVGAFGLDDPVNRLLGRLQLRNEYEDRVGVTVRHLLTHTSGLPADTAGTPPAAGETLQQFVSRVGKTTRPPGEEIIYANWGYHTIGCLIERFSGRPWHAWVTESVLEPLGMASSAIGRAAASAPVAAGHFWSAVDEQVHVIAPYPESDELLNPGGSLVSTVNDLARFLIAHLNGGGYGETRLLRAETVREMHRLHARAGRSAGGMGLAFRVTRRNGRRMICHGGDGLGFTAFIGAYPDDRVGVVMLMNVFGAQTARSVIANTALDLLAGDPPNAARSRGYSKPWALPGAYASTFWDFRADLTTDSGGSALNVKSGLVLSGKPQESRLHEVDDGVFVGHGGMFHGFELTFERGDRDGSASFFGGVYPFRFDRLGDVTPVETPVADEGAPLAGSWRGTAQTPLGPMMVRIEILDRSRATVSTAFAQGVALQDCRAEAGRLSGRFTIAVPGTGQMEMLPRLIASGGKLRGPVYARGWFGEVAMETELSRG